MNKKIRFSIGLLILSLLTPTSFLFAQLSEKAIGGEITDIRPCECTASWLLTIDDYTSEDELELVYKPGFSIIYLYYSFMTATYLVGSYNSTQKNMCVALNTSGNCKPVPSDGVLGSQPGTGFSL